MPPGGKFSLGDYWLDRVPGSPNWYRCWYDAGSGAVSRRTLKTADLEEAKVKLAAFVLGDPAKDPQEPQSVPLIVVFKDYWENYSDKRPNPGNARRAGDLVLEHMGDAVHAGEFTKSKQEAFMRWLADPAGLNHSVGTISRHLAIVNAAFRRAAQPQVIKTEDGREVERQILKYAPQVYYQERHIAEVVDKPEPEPRDWQPTIEQLGAFINAIHSEHVFRYVMLALNTWARPEAITDIDPSRQVDWQHRLLNLNPPGRRQNKKYRPVVPITDCLWGWLQVWPQEGRLVAIERKVEEGEEAKVEPVDSIRKAFELTRERAGVPELTRYSLRHLMGTQARASRDPRVPPEQKDLWMGHRRLKSRTSEWYERFDPNFLEDARKFTDAFMVRLQKHCRRSLFASKSLSKPHLRVVGDGS